MPSNLLARQGTDTGQWLILTGKFIILSHHASNLFISAASWTDATSSAGCSVETHTGQCKLIQKNTQQLATHIQRPEPSQKLESALAFLVQHCCDDHSVQPAGKPPGSCSPAPLPLPTVSPLLVLCILTHHCHYILQCKSHLRNSVDGKSCAGVEVRRVEGKQDGRQDGSLRCPSVAQYFRLLDR